MRILLIILFISFAVGCTRDDLTDSALKLKEGSYGGSFNYDTLHLWESIGIKRDSFQEYASGGMMYQKYPKYCLTKGTYKVSVNSIYFNNIEVAQPPNGNIANYEKEFLLMGSYFIEEHTDSTIIFWRTAEKGKQEYNLKLYSTNK